MDSYIRAPKTVKEEPEFRFKIDFNIGIRSSELWELLTAIVEKYDSKAAVRIGYMLENSSTSFIYGPSIGSIVDRHGPAIRSAGNAKEILSRCIGCKCMVKYPKFIDQKVGHVRTMDTSILGKLIAEHLNKGLNFRPSFSKSKMEVRNSVCMWAESIIRKLRHKAIRLNMAAINSDFRKAIMPLIYWVDGADYYHLEREAAKFNDLVICSTDKIAQTASIECINWYRKVCHMRLISSAFDCTLFPKMLEKSVLKEYTPWDSDSEFKPAILFGMAKQHKRAKDSMAYRWITSACSDMSKPLSDEALRILTFLWNKARYDCSQLDSIHDAKFFW